MYNPDSPEGRFPNRNDPDDKGEPPRTEWVEIHNAGDGEVDLAGWRLSDEDGQTSPVPDGVKLDAGETAVFIPKECSIDEFRKAWGGGFKVIPVDGWGRGGLSNLANSPSDTNEVLEIIDADGNTVDQVNYDDESQWPSDSPDGPSICLAAGAFDTEANDAGDNWARSEAGTDGARASKQTDHFTDGDVGSPGSVPKAEDGE